MMTAAMASFHRDDAQPDRRSPERSAAEQPAAHRCSLLHERRLTMASTPIIRYYDHMRLVYEVQTGCGSCAGTTEGEVQGEGEENRRSRKTLRPASRKQTPRHKDGGSRLDLPQQTGAPVFEPAVSPTLNDSDFMESSLTFQQQPAHSAAPMRKKRERSTVWTA